MGIYVFAIVIGGGGAGGGAGGGGGMVTHTHMQKGNFRKTIFSCRQCLWDTKFILR